MEFDTGIALYSMSLKQFKEFHIEKKLFKTDINMRTYKGEIIRPIGVAYVKCAYKHQKVYGKLYIIKKEVDPIFERSWMKEIKLELSDIKYIQIKC